MASSHYKLTLKEMKKRKWRVNRKISNYDTSLHPGAIVSIVGKRSGVEIEGPKCRRCHVSVFMRKVPMDCLDPV